ncbi:MAG TPA: Do family serine endopeptidase [Verrucomicrobiae bacterium]|jgi:serine protease Do|nr:Do family serine endopeptidase [Verrucomicrobiae bacterium]
MKHYLELAGRRLAAPALLLALLACLGSYEMFKPSGASAASAAPPAAPLDDNSVSAILSLDRAMETLTDRVTPAVVNITAASRVKPEASNEEIQKFFGPFFGQRAPQMQPQVEHVGGSGFVISPDGYIVTNNHVVQGATDIRVTFNDRRVLAAKLVGTDPLTDLAVLKVAGSNMPSLPWGESSALHTGQTVLAFGNPFMFRFSVTRGIVSALNRANPYSDNPRKPGQFIQTDAAINQGNSGGPLVDARGEVMGINTFLISPSGAFAGMGFAIPSQIARPVVATLIKEGKINHAYIGVSISDVTPENAKFFHMDKTAGAVISQVEADSPGAKAGLKVGDVITEVDGKKVSDAGELQATISGKHPDTKVALDVLRDGKNVSVPVTLQEIGDRRDHADAEAVREHGKARWGLGLANITPEIREQVHAPGDIHGALVANVQAGSPADNAGISRGDIILEVNRHKVESSADVRRELEGVPKGQDALVLVWSNGGTTFRVLQSAEEGT